ncbi:MAG: bacterioferritin [Hyphomicrobiaceae bacterium]
MPDVSQSLKNLQTALTMELAAVNQYILHAHVLEDWGLDSLARKMRAEMQEELGHAQEYIRRIMFLKGDPQLKPAKVPQRAQALTDMFKADLVDEEDAIEFYSKAARTAAEAGDIGTRIIFEKIVLDEEGHKAWLELQLDLLQRIGEQAYVARYMSITSSED